MTMGVRSMIQHKNDRPRSPQSNTDGKETRKTINSATDDALSRIKSGKEAPNASHLAMQ